MANALYNSGKDGIGTAAISLTGATIKAVPVDATYVPNLVTHANLSDITAGKRVCTPVALAGKTFAAGVFDANDVTFPAATGVAITQLVLYKDTGVEATSTLIAVITDAAGIPYTPVGQDLIVRWSDGVNKIFALV